MDTSKGRPSRSATTAPALQSLQVQWSVDKNTAKELSFHIVTTATLTRGGSVEPLIIQEVSDGLSILSGTTGTAQQYRMTAFKVDEKESIPTSMTKVIYDDKPGISTGHGLAADTDLKYVFGAQWTVKLGNTVLAQTTPLFGVITGAFVGSGRTFTPSATVTATWDALSGTWLNQGALLDAYPAWAPYPTPAVDNT